MLRTVIQAAAVTANLNDLLHAEARKLGLDAIGVARIAPNDQQTARLAQFLEQGRHGDMDWMESNADRRGDPRRLWPEAKSAIMVGQSYAPGSNPLDELKARERGLVSVYAKGRDYHDVLKSKIKSLARAFAAASGADVKVFVDTAPLMEKPLAAKAGLGWQGKHTNLVSREHGSWLFLGAILTTADLEPDAAEVDHCGSCQRCLDVCPTKAFPAPYQLDARRCLAYLSIEHKGHIAPEFRVPMGNRVFGCDDCLAICPWNKFASAASELRFAARAETDNPPHRGVSGARRRIVPAAVCRHAGQADRAQSDCPQCADRRRKFRRCIADAADHAASRRCFTARSGDGGLGGSPSSERGGR